MLPPKTSHSDVKVTECSGLSYAQNQDVIDRVIASRRKDKASPSLEEGEIVCEALGWTYQQRPRQEGSSHFLYNSYESNIFKTFVKIGSNGISINDNQIIQLEVNHLQRSLNDKVKEFEHLSTELEEAQVLISKLKEEFGILGTQ